MKRAKNGVVDPTVSGHVELDETVQVLNVAGQPLDLIVAETQASEAVQSEEVLKRRRSKLGRLF